MKRIKLWEIGIGLLFFLDGLSSLITGEMYNRGVPVLYPRYYGAAIMLFGVAIPVMAWFLRSPSRKRKDEEK
ncbi:MAG TPA: hypothetical protein PKB11_10115 [Desulfovibrio sp.]|uniref:hypothetical protein n=1 Tax=Desulfovibrio sp. TaxID=885 RepID=UPI002A413DE5|nr:hypothetical protein [Desulfovibrio sp.]MDY0307914.1 hypothetical protein [Desulfovibrionaceae bacterium]HMM39098.1 hypothetical protein [Desulfovibrio sp.]